MGLGPEGMQIFCLIFIFFVELALANSDSDALLNFKRGIEGDPSGRVSGSWDANSLASDKCPFNWYGVQCSDGHVTSIMLNDLGLVGSLQVSALSGLSNLRNLSLENNQLTGILPPEIGLLEPLEFLDLSSNSFQGPIPASFTGLKNLVHLNLSQNEFTGPVPSNVGNLRQLKYLDLRSNQFSGNIGSIFNQLQNVSYLDVSRNQFSGSIDSDFANMTVAQSIEYVNVSHNGLRGALFSSGELSVFDNLEVFDASYNHLVGQIPPFHFIFSLRILRLGNNQFSGSLPQAFLRESSMVLSELDLSCNQLEGPVGNIDSSTLNILNLSSNSLSGSLPAKVGHIAIVDLSNNMLSGNVSRIQGWGNYVEEIDLSSNLLTGALPNETSQFLRLSLIKLSNNSLQGPIPLVIGTYPKLNIVDLSHNQMNGYLPLSLFTSLTLAHLNLSYNNFTGTIPLPVSSNQVSNLVSLDLSDNSLSGPLSEEIGNMEQLQLLNLKRNDISGHIPAEIGRLHSLVDLDLSINNLEGELPDDFPNGLKSFNVSYNNLSGIVPINLRKFPDSSFHPGNLMLILPKDVGPDINLKKKSINSAIKVAIIAASVGVAALIVIILLVICFRNRVQNTEGGVGEVKKDGEKDNNQRGSSFPRIFGLQPSPKLPSTSMSFSQDLLLSSQFRSSSGLGGLTGQQAVVKARLSDKSPLTESSSPKDSGKSSPISSTPHSSDYRLSDIPAPLKVYSPDKLEGVLHLFDNSFLFTAEELSSAPAEVIGRSCHGTTYKATLGSAHVLAIKWLREGIAKGKKEFAREAKKLANIRHPNIVSLRGYYWGPKEHERLLVSDYVNAPSLAVHLYGAEPRETPPLSLIERLKVATDVACCLNYLHNERAIPHGNLKSTNILLEVPNLNSYLTDYSLHRIMNSAGTAEQVLNSGALGYCPPEFASTSKPCPSLKSDIYAFGVILLEIITGKCAGEIVTGNPGVVDLTEWVKLLASENRSVECFDTVVSNVEDSVTGPPKGLEEMLRISLKCILPAAERPDIRTVFEELLSIVV